MGKFLKAAVGTPYKDYPLIIASNRFLLAMEKFLDLQNFGTGRTPGVTQATRAAVEVTKSLAGARPGGAVSEHGLMLCAFEHESYSQKGRVLSHAAGLPRSILRPWAAPGRARADRDGGRADRRLPGSGAG